MKVRRHCNARLTHLAANCYFFSEFWPATPSSSMKILSFIPFDRRLARGGPIGPHAPSPLQGDSAGPASPYRGALRARVITAFILCAFLVGCGNTLYLVRINRAERDLEEAERLGAATEAAYEYYSAKARVEEARHQAAQAEYGPAAQLSDDADDFAVKAINICMEKRRTIGGKP
jgi:hypothetical protein